jgi:hypothetical protein
MSIINLKLNTTPTIESDPANTLNFDNFRYLYPIDILKIIWASATVGTAVSTVYETTMKGRLGSTIQHPLNMIPILMRAYINCITYSPKYHQLLVKNNPYEIFKKNFIWGFFLGGYSNFLNLISLRKRAYNYDRTLLKGKQNKSRNLLRQSHFSFFFGGVTLGTSWGLYFSLCTYLKKDDTNEYYVKKVLVSLISYWTGYLFYSFFNLITYQTDYFTFTYRKLDFSSVLPQLRTLDKQFLNYMFYQKKYSQHIIFGALNLVTLDIMHLV